MPSAISPAKTKEAPALKSLAVTSHPFNGVGPVIKALLLVLAMFFVYLEENMIDGYMTINEVAKLWNLTPRRIRAMCLNEQIEGAVKFGREWAIPINSSKPKDGRMTTGEYRSWRKNK